MATAIPLTEQQRQALNARQGGPVEVVDPATNQVYFLVSAETIRRVPELREQISSQELLEADLNIPPGMLRSMQAFWRDLPELLKNKRNRGKWVVYHGDQCIGIGKYLDLIHECDRRGLDEADYHLGLIEPHELPPWEPEEIEAGGHEVDEYEIFDETPDPEEPA